MFDDATLAKLVKQGCKVECPVCGKSYMSQSYRDFHNSGIGDHIRSKHPELLREVLAASKRFAATEKEKIQEERKEKELRPKRKFIVSGEFLDEVVDEMQSLIGFMEAYYIQGGCDKNALELIDRIEKMHSAAIFRGEPRNNHVLT